MTKIVVIFTKNKEKDNDYFYNIDYFTLSRNFLPNSIRNDPKTKYIIISDIHENKYDLLMNTYYPYYSSYFYTGKIKDGLEYLSKEEELIFDEFGNNKYIDNIFLFLSKENTSYLVELFDIMQQMLRAGYHKLENNYRIDDWIVSCQDQIMHRFIEIMQFESYLPQTELTWCEIFCENRQFRQSLVQTMIKVFQKICIDYFKMKYSEVSKEEYFIENAKEIRKKIKKYE